MSPVLPCRTLARGERLRRSARSTNEYWLSVGLKVTSTPVSWFPDIEVVFDRLLHVWPLCNVELNLMALGQPARV